MHARGALGERGGGHDPARAMRFGWGEVHEAVALLDLVQASPAAYGPRRGDLKG
jgi:hypothetical protein